MNEQDKSKESGHEHHEHHHEHEHEHELVTITIDTKEYKIHRGAHTVAELKQVGGVPAAYELEQLVGGKLVPLADNASVTIKGGEVFLSHPKDGGAS
jgi:hypothetical protein